jgi:hypothetical protein
MHVLFVMAAMALPSASVLLARAPATPLAAKAAANPVVWSAKMLCQRDAKI